MEIYSEDIENFPAFECMLKGWFWGVQIKSDDSPLTRADEEADKIRILIQVSETLVL